MQKFTNPLDNIKIAAPCDANWDEMRGDERKRYCSMCNLNVFNLSNMTRTEAESFLINSEGRVCVKFYRRSDGTVITQNCPVGWAKIKQKVSRTATAVFALLAGFFGGNLAFHQTSFDSSDLMEKVTPVSDLPPKNESFAIEGQVSNLDEIKLQTRKAKKTPQMTLGRVVNESELEFEPAKRTEKLK